MPRGGDNGRGGADEYTKRVYALLPPEKLAEINVSRRPSERVGNAAVCGAKMSANAIQKQIDKGKSIDEIDVVCTKPAGYRTVHEGVGYCTYHGGNTPAGKKSAARTSGQAFIERYKADVTLFGGDKSKIDITPEQAILEEVRRSVAMVRFLEEAIAKWQYNSGAEPEAGLGGLPQLVDETMKGNASFTDEREWLLLYRAEREHMVKVARMAIDAGIAERLVTIAEDQGRTLAIAIRMVLDALDLTPDQVDRVPIVVPPILRQVQQGLPAPQIQGA